MAKKCFVFVDEAKLLSPKLLLKRFSALSSAPAAIFHNFKKHRVVPAPGFAISANGRSGLVIFTRNSVLFTTEAQSHGE